MDVAQNPLDSDTVKKIVEAALLASDRPLSVEELTGLFREPSGDLAGQQSPMEGESSLAPGDRPNRQMIKAALAALEQDCE
ncbi:MAG: hypothetical protein KJO08_11180, partial [Gammaproteobacteria bacterium]|nr:hypothetical protein [Gammaproteobacteria bacterium]NNJ83529.1 hypothetical protein [Gammaproteobacteria bacterium]